MLQCALLRCLGNSTLATKPVFIYKPHHILHRTLTRSLLYSTLSPSLHPHLLFSQTAIFLHSHSFNCVFCRALTTFNSSPTPGNVGKVATIFYTFSLILCPSDILPLLSSPLLESFIHFSPVLPTAPKWLFQLPQTCQCAMAQMALTQMAAPPLMPPSLTSPLTSLEGTTSTLLHRARSRTLWPRTMVTPSSQM